MVLRLDEQINMPVHRWMSIDPPRTNVRRGRGVGKVVGVLPYIGYTGTCATGKGMVFKPFTLGQGLVIIENWLKQGPI